jgi:hypothetical protein
VSIAVLPPAPPEPPTPDATLPGELAVDMAELRSFPDAVNTPVGGAGVTYRRKPDGQFVAEVHVPETIRGHLVMVTHEIEM